MAERILQAAIIALGVIVGCYFIGGRYELLRLNEATAIHLDRWTGSIMICEYGQHYSFGCAPEKDGASFLDTR